MLNPASGVGVYQKGKKICIRLLRQGCTNRPFYHVVVAEVRPLHFKCFHKVIDFYYFQARFSKDDPVIEQLGTYDPLPNEYNEKLAALNYERIRYWIGNGAVTSRPLEQLLGRF